MYTKPELNVERISAAVKSSPLGIIGDSQAAPGANLLNAALS